MLTFAQRRLQSDFKAWLDQEIYISKGFSHCPRKYMILDIINDISVFVKKEGYTFRTTEKEMAQDLARFLFRSQRGLLKGHKHARNPDETPEDYDMYCHLYDYSRWKPFLDSWQHADDFCQNREGELALATLPEFVWFHINIRTSTPTQKVDEMYAQSDSEDDSKSIKRKAKYVDPYLEDQANNVSKQNRWD
jgi:hypothetical protein